MARAADQASYAVDSVPRLAAPVATLLDALNRPPDPDSDMPTCLPMRACVQPRRRNATISSSRCAAGMA